MLITVEYGASQFFINHLMTHFNPQNLYDVSYQLSFKLGKNDSHSIILYLITLMLEIITRPVKASEIR